MKFIKTYFILLILLSCSKDNQKKESLYNKNIQQVSLEDFNIDKEITGKILNVDYKTEFHEILSIDTLLILKTSSRHKEFFKIYNLNTLEHLGDVGVRGEGPEEWKNVDINHVLTKENDNYMISVLKDNISSKQEAKESEHHFINAYGDQCINNNKSIIIDMKEYLRNYQKEYNKCKKSGE